MTGKIAVFLVFAALAGCARLEGGNWPSLHEGFTPREAPAPAVDDPTASTDKDAGLVGPDDGDQAPARAVPIELAAQIQAAKDRLEQTVLRAGVDSGEGESSDQVLAWYEAQLELSRMGRFIDLLAPYPDALAEMNMFLHSVRERLSQSQPAKE